MRSAEGFGRPWLVRFCALGFMGLCLGLGAWGNATGRVGIAAPLLDPQAWDGRELTLSLVEVRAIEADSFEVRKGAVTLRVMGPTTGLEVGREVDLGGTWRADTQSLQQEWRTVAEGRDTKRRLGVFGLVLLLVVLPLGLRWTERGWVIRG